MLPIVKKIFNILSGRLTNMIRLGIVKIITDGKTQLLQVKTARGEVISNVVFLEPYGFNSKPREGSETLLFSVQGNPTNVVALTIGNRELRFQSLKSGEVCLNDEFGNFIHLQEGGNLSVVSPETFSLKAKNIIMEASSITLDGQTVLGGTSGKPAAKLGDKVVVDPQTHEGTITEGSSKVSVA